MTPEERMEKIEREVDGIKQKRKDGWDKFGIFCAALLPLVIAGVGGMYSYLSQRAATEVAKIQADAEFKIRQSEKAAESKINQAELVLKFFEPLMGSDKRRSEFATNALLVGAPDFGPVLVRIVAMNTAAPVEAEYATTALRDRRDLLIRQLFSDQSSQRVEAYQQLINAWSNDETLISAVIEYGKVNTTNGNGIYNALVLLAHMQRDTIRKQKVEILEFVSLVEGGGDKIKERATILRSRLG